MSTNNGNKPLTEQPLASEIKQPIGNAFQSEEIVQQNIGRAEVHNFNISQKPIETDFWIYRIIVGGLTSTVLGCLIGAIALQVSNRPTPELLTALGTGSLGALSGLLAPSPVKK
ncbi:hypothetical protein [Scytonema sp. PCC 10023]|uniref:hypothetical protein n=1 Tax=Scytonema sp. PCC 10023 TaxID=1680591 RepID=UPI0039C6EF91